MLGSWKQFISPLQTSESSRVNSAFLNFPGYPYPAPRLYITCLSAELCDSSSLIENALLIQCHASECGMKSGFQPLQELAAAAASQVFPRDPTCLQQR